MKEIATFFTYQVSNGELGHVIIPPELVDFLASHKIKEYDLSYVPVMVPSKGICFTYTVVVPC